MCDGSVVTNQVVVIRQWSCETNVGERKGGRNGYVGIEHETLWSNTQSLYKALHWLLLISSYWQASSINLDADGIPKASFFSLFFLSFSFSFFYFYIFFFYLVGEINFIPNSGNKKSKWIWMLTHWFDP